MSTVFSQTGDTEDDELAEEEEPVPPDRLCDCVRSWLFSTAKGSRDDTKKKSSAKPELKWTSA
jgi:hypothetical protein